MTTGSRTEGAPSYAELLVRFQPHTIQSEEDAAAVQDQMDALMDQDTLTEAERQYLSLLGDLLVAWERNRYDLPDIYGVDAIREIMRTHGVRQIDLVGPVFPNRFVASAVIRGKRPLSYETVRKLSAFFHVPADVFYPRAESGAS